MIQQSLCGSSAFCGKGQNNLRWLLFQMVCLLWVKLAQKGFNKDGLILRRFLGWKDACFLCAPPDWCHSGWSGLISARLSLHHVLCSSELAAARARWAAWPCQSCHWLSSSAFLKHFFASLKRLILFLSNNIQILFTAFYSQRSMWRRKGRGGVGCGNST